MPLWTESDEFWDNLFQLLGNHIPCIRIWFFYVESFEMTFLSHLVITVIAIMNIVLMSFESTFFSCLVIAFLAFVSNAFMQRILFSFQITFMSGIVITFIAFFFTYKKNPLQNLLALDSLYLSHFLTEWAEILRAYSLSGKFKFRHKTVILQHCSIACTPTESPSPKQPISQPFLNGFDWNFEWLLSRWKGLSLESTVWIQLQPF